MKAGSVTAVRLELRSCIIRGGRAGQVADRCMKMDGYSEWEETGFESREAEERRSREKTGYNIHTGKKAGRDKGNRRGRWMEGEGVQERDGTENAEGGTL